MITMSRRRDRLFRAGQPGDFPRLETMYPQELDTRSGQLDQNFPFQ
ncbi:MAG: hypothetical protein MRJ96_09275 [Nitrospirales bacterium]|nr:hypothetical protein [Nitrospirales bacterium]